MLRSYKVEALVLKRIKKGETDSYYTLLTRYNGILRVIAKGIRKIGSRRAPYLDLFNHIILYLAKGKSVDVVTDVAPVKVYSHLKSHLTRVASVFKLAELTERLVPEGQSHPEIFDKLLNTIELLNHINEIKKSALIEDYGMFLLHDLGYIPHSNSLKGKELDKTLEEIMEKKIKANVLLSKLVL